MILEPLLEELRTLSTSDVKREASIDEIDEVCRNPVFQLLCDLCEVLRTQKDPKGHFKRSKR